MMPAMGPPPPTAATLPPHGVSALADAPCSVVIPCHGGAELTRECIASLLSQRPAPPAEILLVDNASPDDTAALGAVDRRVRVLRQPHNLGFAGGVNAGVRAAREPYVLVLNNDTRATVDLVAQLLAELAADPGLGAVAPLSNHVKGAALLPIGDRGSTAAGRAQLQTDLAARPRVQHVATLAGLCLMLRRATFAEVGFFDERFGHGNFEDDDFCLRLRLRGYRLAIAGRVFLHHEGHATFRRLGLDLSHELVRRRDQFIAKWCTDPAGRAHVAAWHGDLAGAAAAAREARLAWPRWADADWHLGCWHAAAGDRHRAGAHFAALLRSDPAHADAALELATLRVAQRDLTGADVALRAVAGAALTAEQQLRLSILTGHRAWFAGAIDAALASFGVALELGPEDPVMHNWVGACHLAAGATARAATHFELAAARGHALANTNLGICRAQLGDPHAARASFARAVALLPHDEVARANLAACEQLAATGTDSRRGA